MSIRTLAYSNPWTHKQVRKKVQCRYCCRQIDWKK